MELPKAAFLSTTSQEKNLVTTGAVNGELEGETEWLCSLRTFPMENAISVMMAMKTKILMILFSL